MENFIASLISMFIVEPLQADLAEKLRAARAPQAVYSEVTGCAQSAAPAIIERATSDPWWAVSSAVGVWIGTASTGDLLAQAAPNCASAVTSARRYLAQGEG
jgi:hypothetical protein